MLTFPQASGWDCRPRQKLFFSAETVFYEEQSRRRNRISFQRSEYDIQEVKMKSYIAKPQEVERKWYVLDAEGKTLGRLATEAASILRGKRKPIYTPHVDTGDYVIVINAEKIEVTGKKRKEKIYKRHTGYPGGLREITFEKLQAKKPDEIIRHAVKGMLPKGPLGRQMYKKLKVYAGPEHNHAAQKPETWTLVRKGGIVNGETVYRYRQKKVRNCQSKINPWYR